MSLTIECQKRPEGVKPNALRRDGLIPTALYGHKGLETMTLAVKEKDATNLLKEASINKSVIEVKVPDVPWEGKALIQEVQSHPWKRTLFHLSFYCVADS